MSARNAEVEELLVSQKCTKYRDFEAYLAKFEASTYAKFAKDDCWTIAVTDERLGTGQMPFREDLNEWRFMSLRMNKTAFFRSGPG